MGLVALCGGLGTCGRCIVQLRAGELSPPTSVELRKLTEAKLEQGYRLACQCKPQGDVKLYVPPSSLNATQRAQIEGQESDVEFEPAVTTISLALSTPTLEDPRSDSRRLADACEEALGQQVSSWMDFALLRELPHVLRESDWNVKASVKAHADEMEVVAVLPSAKIPLGLAVDLGTTKIAGYLVNMETGETLQAKGVMNPQISYGEDVMARITVAMESAERSDILRNRRGHRHCRSDKRDVCGTPASVQTRSSTWSSSAIRPCTTCSWACPWNNWGVPPMWLRPARRSM